LIEKAKGKIYRPLKSGVKNEKRLSGKGGGGT